MLIGLVTFQTRNQLVISCFLLEVVLLVGAILYIITTVSVRVCVRPTRQFRVLMTRRNRPGRSDPKNENRPEQSDSENGNPSPDDWCAASFVKTKRRKSRGKFPLLLNKSDHETEISRRVFAATEQIRPWDGNLEASFRCYWTNPTTRRKSRGEFSLLLNKSHHDFLVDFFGGWNSPLLNKSNHDFLVDFFGGCHSQDHWELQKLKRKLFSWSTNCCKNSKESISFLKKLRGSISGSAIAAAETKRIIDLRISHRCCRN